MISAKVKDIEREATEEETHSSLLTTDSFWEYSSVLVLTYQSRWVSRSSIATINE